MSQTSSSLHVRCPKCAASVSARNSGLDHQLVRCTECGNIFQVSAPPPSEAGPSPPGPGTMMGTPGAPPTAAPGAYPGAAPVPIYAGAPVAAAAAVAAPTYPGAPLVANPAAPPTYGGAPLPDSAPFQSAPRQKLDIPLSTERKVFWTISLLMGLWSGFVLVSSVVAAGALGLDTEAELAVLGGLAVLLGFLPGLFGVGLGIAPFEKHLVNPWPLWIPPALSAAAVGLWLMIVAVGLATGDPIADEQRPEAFEYDWMQSVEDDGWNWDPDTSGY